ncbi:Fpg/Nei family DNA glycosylase [Thermasporomyces composti]|uniref:DNA-(apurinic or apyrimidinic site) lyase n=1 Tax=Thermasporomyces composti TaxID=696763 RepID=A0A3D9V505_THECX|nr:DNA-formamidopyrimidine glycosylase family protein [Thermasporomyces composti]REF36892.1 endonuclease-8 [Thermasporomyces composti]
MPEGHLIHRYARDQEQTFAGALLRVSSPQKRFLEGARHLDGSRLERVEAYGKHLFYWWEGKEVLHVHLGPQGTFLPVRPGAPPLAQARLRISGPDAGIDLVAPTVCELLGPEGRDRIVARLGPDPLRDDANPDAAFAAIAGSSRMIGALVLDQAVLAGVGNVLRAEGLFLTGLHPTVRGTSVSRDVFDSLWSHLTLMMRRAVAEGRIITVRPPGVDVRTIPESEGRYVYKQERCRRCGTPVQTGELAGRTAYACPRDQPPPS